MSEKDVYLDQVSLTNVVADVSQFSVRDKAKRFSRDRQPPKPAQLDHKQSSTAATYIGNKLSISNSSFKLDEENESFVQQTVIKGFDQLLTNDHDQSTLRNSSSFKQSIDSHLPSFVPIGAHYASYEQSITASNNRKHQSESNKLLSSAGDTSTPIIDIISQFSTSQTPQLSANYDVMRMAENEIVWGAIVGDGAHGTVCRAKCSRDVAVKIITTRDETKIQNEIEMMNRLKHQNVIEIFGYGMRANFDHFIVMEYMENGTLSNGILIPMYLNFILVLHDEPKISIPSKQMINWAKQLAKGLVFIHSHEISHRDLKPLNILLKNQFRTLKIADFGTVRDMDTIELTKNVGTIIYMAPEVFSSSNYTIKCDIFSFGITLCEMFTRHKPYSTEIRSELKKNSSEFIKEVSRIDSPLRPTLTSNVPISISMMTKRCWMTRDDVRPTMNECLRIIKSYELEYATDEETMNQSDSIKSKIEKNQSKNENVFNRVDNSKIDEIKNASMLFVNQILNSSGIEQKIRCEQTLEFIDRLTICNDSIWVYYWPTQYYQMMVYWCYWKLKDHLDVDERKKISLKAKEKYSQTMNLQLWKQKNHPDRMWILSDSVYLCYLCDSSIDNESIDLLKKWIDEGKSMEKGILSEREWTKSKMWIERSEIDLEMRELWRKWVPKEGTNQKHQKQQLLIAKDKEKYCDGQLERLRIAINMGVKFTPKEIRNLYYVIKMRLNAYSNYWFLESRSRFCNKMLNRLDQIQFCKDANWIYYYLFMINECYSTLSDCNSNSNKRRKIANRMQSKYRQLIDISNEIFANELNHPYRIDIIENFSVLLLKRYKNEIDSECIEYQKSITNEAKEQSKGLLTDFEYEYSRCYLVKIKNRLRNVVKSNRDVSTTRL